MSISSALTNALSGLTAQSKAAELVSSNIANVSTPGYARRELILASRTVGTPGQGVQVVGVQRSVDLALLGDRRLAQSAAGDADTRAAFFKRVERAIGTPDDSSSISGRAAALNSALIEASSHPESESRLSNVLNSAKALARQIGSASKDVQSARTTANAEIASQVNQLNISLTRVAKLNSQINIGIAVRQDVTSLQDQRQQIVDQIARIIPVREVQQPEGAIYLYTDSGKSILDVVPAVFGFTATNTVTPGMTNGAGLSGLTLNGNPISTGAGSFIAGGTLRANFAIRDELGETAQAQLDAVARDLVERFADPALDVTRALGGPGLFTDNGAAFDPLTEVGLSQRLAINAAADPDQGGALCRLRDGLGATAIGPVGNSALLNDLRAALTAAREPISGGFMAGQRSFANLATDFLNSVATGRLNADGDATYAAARLETFTVLEAENGVDTDAEMQSLLQIEQAYAANAKVIAAVQQMIQAVLDI
ncbi:MAG: flagellar hook-associated protein FlgK [Candidatus Saccharibacteria bacterium]|nr:flagellar hook-associated protein FlgK [Pseudorhodobacter sp.]